MKNAAIKYLILLLMTHDFAAAEGEHSGEHRSLNMLKQKLLIHVFWFFQITFQVFRLIVLSASSAKSVFPLNTGVLF